MLRGEGRVVAQCTVTRVFKAMGLHGVVRGRRVTSTVPEPLAHRPQDLVRRNFVSPETTVGLGPDQRADVARLHVRPRLDRRLLAARRRLARHDEAAHALALDALEPALYDRALSGRLVHQSDRGSQFLVIRYTDRLLEAGIESSVGSRGNAYDNALAESINALCRAKAIHHLGPRKGAGARGIFQTGIGGLYNRIA